MTVFSDRDAHALFDQALEQGGLEIDCGAKNTAINLRQRLNHFRKLDREANKEVYPLDSDMYGRSAYDVFELIISKEKETVINIRYRPAITILSIRRIGAPPPSPPAISIKEMLAKLDLEQTNDKS